MISVIVISYPREYIPKNDHLACFVLCNQSVYSGGSGASNAGGGSGGSVQIKATTAYISGKGPNHQV